MPDNLDKLIRDLRHWSTRRSVAAAEALGNSADPRAVEALIATLPTSGMEWANTPRVEAALVALARLGDTRAVEPIAALLDSLVPSVRATAAGTLGHIGDPRAIGPLVRSLGGDVRGSENDLMAALASLGAPLAGPIVVAMRNHYGIGMGYWADKIARELGRVNEEDRLRILAEPDGIGLLIRSLGNEDRGARREVIEGWVRYGRTSIKPLFALVEQPDPRARLWAADALGRIADTEVRRRLPALLGSADDEKRLAAAVGLGHLGDIQVIPTLLHALQGGDEDARVAAAGALGAIGAPAAAALHTLERLEDLAAHRDDRDVYRDAIRRIRKALRHAPTELEAAAPPAGRGTEPEAASAPLGRGTEPESAGPA